MKVLLLSGLLAATSPSVLLVTLDTFRGDFLSAVGSDRVSTPSLDAMAREGVLFMRARSPVPLTLPAHASILTGLYPPEHGVRDNGTYALGETNRTLAEAFAERGYDTAAFIGSFVLDRRFGLSQGFSTYDDAIETDAATLETFEAERKGDVVVDAFERWLGSRKNGAPFFAWVHLYDPHAPYDAPEPYRSRYPDDPYAAEIATTDALAGRLRAAVPPGTLVAVVGDHGEGLGEHGEPTHSLFIYNATLHVPLLLSGPGVPQGRRVSSLVGTIDLPSTLLDYAGVDATLGRGESLRPLIEGGSSPPRELYSESLYGYHHFGWSPLHGLESESFHFIDAPRRELYDVERDPGERNDVLQERRPVSRSLFARLEELRTELGTVASTSLEIDADTRARLESLGYVTSSAGAPDPNGNLPDPKDEIATYLRVQRAQFARMNNDCPAALDALMPIVTSKEGPPMQVAYEIAGACLVRLGDLDRARALYRDALDRGLESADFHVELGVIAYAKGELAEAKKEIEVALALTPSNVLAHYHLGDVLRAMRQDAEAIEAYRQAIAVNPRYVYAWNGLGMTLSRAGANDEALEAFARVVELEPDEPRGHFNLAAQLERMGQRAEALERYRHFLEISTDEAFPRERARAREAVRRLGN